MQFNGGSCSSPSSCLISFFNLYGNTFYLARECISVVNDGRRLPRRYYHNPSTIFLMNPFDMTIDVGAAAFNFNAARQLFRRAHLSMTTAVNANLQELTLTLKQ